MKCEKCGASLSLDIKNCPYCGMLNKAAKRHISDMDKYEREFKNTRWQVIQNSRWFSKYMALLLAIVLVIIANVVIVTFRYSKAYSIRWYKMENYNKTHNEENQKQIADLLERGEYWKVYFLYQSYNRLYENNFTKWMHFYDAAYAQQKIYDAIMYSKSENEENSYMKSSWVSDVSRALYNFYESFRGTYYYYDGIEEDTTVYLNDMRSEIEDFLYVYFNCTLEDVEKIASSDEAQIASILVRRLADEEE